MVLAISSEKISWKKKIPGIDHTLLSKLRDEGGAADYESAVGRGMITFMTLPELWYAITAVILLLHAAVLKYAPSDNASPPV